MATPTMTETDFALLRLWRDCRDAGEMLLEHDAAGVKGDVRQRLTWLRDRAQLDYEATLADAMKTAPRSKRGT